MTLRWLCRIGLHRWRKMEAWGSYKPDPVYFDQCGRCGKVREEWYD